MEKAVLNQHDILLIIFIVTIYPIIYYYILYTILKEPLPFVSMSHDYVVQSAMVDQKSSCYRPINRDLLVGHSSYIREINIYIGIKRICI